MIRTNAETMREILMRAVDGTPEGAAAAAALIADNARIWQQGSGWVAKADKVAAWRRSEGAPMPTVIRSLVASGDDVAVEATVETPRGVMLVVVFAVFRDGRLVSQREYFVPAPDAEVFEA
jgi:ketosteroid isomerase-like protein